MDVVTIDTRPLGDRSYLVHDGSAALVIDPQRDIDRVERVLVDAGASLTHVAETHIHNDYVSGGHALALRHRARYLVSAGDKVSFARCGVEHGDDVSVGDMTIRVIATPGHTVNHVAYVVHHGNEQAVFSGGNLLYGSVGRTDLVDSAQTVRLTHEQYRSARLLARVVRDDTALYPTHGFGSLCSAGQTTRPDQATIGEQKLVNPALWDDEQHFVEQLIAGLTAYPSYYAHMGPLNLAGGDVPDLSVPVSVSPGELRRRLANGQSVVDLRNRIAFAERHIAGTLSFEHGQAFTTYLGWLLPRDEPFTLVGSYGQVEAAIRDLCRIGIDAPSVAVGTDVAAIAGDESLAAFPRVGWAEVASAQRTGELDVMLDVRRHDEYTADHLADAVHLPLHELGNRLHDVPAGRVWVYCASGYRASIAASILKRAGRDVTLIDAEYSLVPTAEIKINSG